jgi:ribose 1,5-bisphosphokinase
VTKKTTNPAGELALSWRAHGTAYGIPRSIVCEIDHGRIVIANVSRRVIADGLRLAPRSLIAHVTASPEVLAQRLHGRGRETASDIAARLNREAPQLDYGEKLVTINNDGPIEQAGSTFLKALLALAEAS